MHVFYPRIQEAASGGFLWGQGKSCLHREFQASQGYLLRYINTLNKYLSHICVCFFVHIFVISIEEILRNGTPGLTAPLRLTFIKHIQNFFSPREHVYTFLLPLVILGTMKWLWSENNVNSKMPPTSHVYYWRLVYLAIYQLRGCCCEKHQGQKQSGRKGFSSCFMVFSPSSRTPKQDSGGWNGSRDHGQTLLSYWLVFMTSLACFLI